MDSTRILDHDVLAETLNVLDKTLLSTSSSKTLPMLEELMGDLSHNELIDELNIPILTNVCDEADLQGSRAA